MPIIPSDTAKHTAPSAVHGVGSRASSAAQTIAPSTAMYSVTGTAMPSAIRRGQNQTSRRDARARSRPRGRQPRRRAHHQRDRGQPGSTGARSGTPRGPSTNDGAHHGIASRKSPAAENTQRAQRASDVPAGSGGPARRPRAARRSAALTAGCSPNWPVRSAPDGSRTAVTMRKMP